MEEELKQDDSSQLMIKKNIAEMLKQYRQKNSTVAKEIYLHIFKYFQKSTSKFSEVVENGCIKSLLESNFITEWDVWCDFRDKLRVMKKLEQEIYEQSVAKQKEIDNHSTGSQWYKPATLLFTRGTNNRASGNSNHVVQHGSNSNHHVDKIYPNNTVMNYHHDPNKSTHYDQRPNNTNTSNRNINNNSRSNYDNNSYNNNNYNNYKNNYNNKISFCFLILTNILKSIPGRYKKVLIN